MRNLERSGVPRSLAMAMVGHKTENVYRRYAIADEVTLREGAVKLQALHDLQGASAWTGGASGVVVPRQPAVVASHSVREQAESGLSAERSG